MFLGQTIDKTKTYSKCKLFLEITMFLGGKNDKTGHIQSCKVSLSLFDQVSFDRMSGHSFCH